MPRPSWEHPSFPPLRKPEEYSDEEIRAVLSPEDQANFDLMREATNKMPGGGEEDSMLAAQMEMAGHYAALRRKAIDEIRRRGDK